MLYNVNNEKINHLTKRSLEDTIMDIINIYETETFDKWLRGLADRNAKARINVRIGRLSQGNPGDSAPVGEGILEMRIPYGPGYRVYYWYEQRCLVLLLCGGDKSTQSNDIAKAKQLVSELKRALKDSAEGNK
jgi:putative addiction module killer protein